MRMASRVVSVRLDSDLWRRFKVQAALKSQSMSRILSELIRQYLDSCAEGHVEGRNPQSKVRSMVG